MKLIIEDYPYKAEAVRDVLQGIESLRNKDGFVRVSYVGYFYNQEIGDCVFFLPKVIINEANPPRALGKYAPEDIIDVERYGKMEPQDREFIYSLSAWIYRAVKEFQRLNEDNEIVYQNTFSRMDGSNTKVENTLLDVILSMIEFNRRERDFFLFKVKSIHSGYNRISWPKTITQEMAYMQKGRPVYLNTVNRRKEVNYDEELIVIFYSILQHIQSTYGFRTKINFNYELITGHAFRKYLHGYGKRRLRQIKYKYFSDKELMMWRLCYAFFELSDIISSSNQETDYLLVKKFNIVFEAMIDELLSDKELKGGDLADQPDGKIVDHIYAWDGLINDEGQVYYIGDSKYYKFGHDPGRMSVYKQFTYARNVIQYNIGLFLDHPERAGQDYLIYRDDATEGYNITPNFFISALLDNDYNYTEDRLVFRKDAEPQRHFQNRLFDRDTLLLQHYDINFLFVLALYASANSGAIETFKEEARQKFREHVITYLSGKYQFFSLQHKPEKVGGMTGAIERHFRSIIGKTFRPYDDHDILYLSFDTNPKFEEENIRLLETLSEDFNIRHYTLGTDPRAQINHFVDVMQSAAGTAAGRMPLPMFGFEDFGDEVFLLGGYRTDTKNQLQWIHDNMKYNIRDRGQRAKRDGAMSIIDSNVVSARFLVLYRIDDEVHSDYEIYEIDSHRQMTEKEMAALGYQEPNGRYIVYTLKSYRPKFSPLKLHTLLETKRLEELERRRQAGTAHEGWEQKWRGTPLFVTGKEMIQYEG